MSTRVYQVIVCGSVDDYDGPTFYATKAEAVAAARLAATETSEGESVEVEESTVTEAMGRGARLFAALLSQKGWCASAMIVATIPGKLKVRP